MSRLWTSYQPLFASMSSTRYHHQASRRFYLAGRRTLHPDTHQPRSVSYNTYLQRDASFTYSNIASSCRTDHCTIQSTRKMICSSAFAPSRICLLHMKWMTTATVPNNNDNKSNEKATDHAVASVGTGLNETESNDEDKKVPHPLDAPSQPPSVTRFDMKENLHMERNWILQKDMQLYQDIIRTRARLKEANRQKMAANVHRALIGNVAICGAKLAAWASSGSSALLAEFVHSLVDCGNQALLIVGLRESQLSADRRHPYGYGKSIYFWALVSALGTFFLGAGVSMTHAIGSLLEPSLTVITPEVWGVLLFSLSVDGYVLVKTVAETREGQPAGVSYWKHIQNIRDPATMAVLLEDGAACLGVVMALGGILASHVTGNPIYDGVAGVGISTLLGVMGIALTRLNYRFLLGQSVDKEITDDIQQILLQRKSIDRVKSVQSQWTGTDTFSFKAEIDFDGTYLAAMLMPIYQREFLDIRDTMDTELRVLLALYAEDVLRATEREVRHVEALIRLKHPGAEFIELEPMSLDVDRLAIDDNLESDLKRVERESLDRYLKSLKKDASDLERHSNGEANKPTS